MKMIITMTFATLLACHIIVVPLFAQEGEVDGEVEELAILTNDPTKQPLVRVIANPAKFQNQEITVTGYYMSGTHVNHLYLDMDSCQHFDTVNSIVLDNRLNDDGFIPCRRENVKGRLNYSSENRHWRNDSDLRLENVVFTDHIEH